MLSQTNLEPNLSAHYLAIKNPMIHSKVPTINEERDFHFNELFISLTNDKGCIEFGNAVLTEYRATMNRN